MRLPPGNDSPRLRSRLLNELLGPELPDKEPGLGTGVPLEAPDLEVTPAKVDLPTPPSGESENEVSSGLYLRERKKKKCERLPPT